MKKTNFIRLLVLMMVLITGVTSSYAYTLYFYMGRQTGWRDSGAVFKLNSSNEDGGTTMSRVGETDWYTCSTTATSQMYIVRCNPSGGKWNSFSFTPSSSNNVVRLTDWNAGELFSMYVTGDNWNSLGSWDNANANGKMTITAENTFSKTFTNVAASAHEFKVVEKGRWDYSIGNGNVSSNINCGLSNNGDNIQFTPYIATGSTTITYNIKTGKITITCPKIPITLDENGGDKAGSATVDVGSSSLSTISHATRAGWNLTGYWTNTSGGYKVIDADGTFVAYNANVATYLNNATPSTWKKTSSTTLYAQWTQDPSVATLTESSSTTQMWIGVNPTSALTFSATSANVSSGTAVTWSLTDNTGDCTVSTTTSSYAGATFSYTPGSTGEKTITVTMTVGGNNYTKTYSLTVYERWNIYVQKNCGDWSKIALYQFGNGENDDWPGVTGASTACAPYGNKNWYKVTLDSYYPKFILDNNQASSNIEQTTDCTTGSSSGTYTSGTYWYFVYDGTTTSSKNDGKKYYTLTKYTLSAPTVGLTATVTSTNQINLTGNVSAYGGYGSSASDMEEVYFKVNNTKDAASITVSTTNGNFTKTLNNPTPDNTNNTLQAYASNVKGTGNSSAICFTKITLDKQSGSGGTDNVLAVNGAAMASGATAPSRTGYTFGGYYASTGGSGTNYYNSSMGSANNWDQTTATKTIYAKWTAKTYDVILDVNGATSGSNQTVVATYDAAMPTKQKTSGDAITAPSKTGYNFEGYWANDNGTGTQYYTSALASNHIWDVATNETHIYAKWNPKSCDIVFDFDESDSGYGSKTGASTGTTATYDADMTSVTPPTAANGYAFMGYYTGADGTGTQYYDGSGNSVTTWAENTESETTLYAYYKNAEITALTFDAGTVEPGGKVGVTPTIAPTPVGNTNICWTIQHSNGTALDPQPADIDYSDGKLTFSAPSYSGTYKVYAILRKGTTCSGEELDNATASFVVAGSHTVTVNYKCGSDVIKTATSVTGRPTEWSDDIEAPDIFGYTFARWDAADGVTIKNGDSDPVTTTTDETIKIKATYAGSLTAVYTQNQMIFFKNTLGWESVYVNFYASSYWNNPKGSGNSGVTNKNLSMTQYGETDIWYYDYGAASITPSLYVSFTSQSQNGAENFWHEDGVDVVYPANYADNIHTDRAAENGFKAATPMFIPLATQDPVLLNSKAHYYNAGYWTTYTPGTGYTLEIYNGEGNKLEKSATFTSNDDLMPMKVVLDLEGGRTYKFQIRRGGTSSAGIYYGNTGTMTYTDHGQDVAWDLSNYPSLTMAGLTTNAAGDYTFNLSYSAYHNESTDKDEYRLRIAVDYPVASGDYRLLYTDDVHTNIHPSAIVPKENDGTAIVSFFVRHDKNPVVRIQQATVALDGTITWKEYPTDGAPTNQIDGTIATAISSGGTDVYNFNLSMNGSGELTVSSAEIYEGKFYIRTDAANSKWDNYTTDKDHQMTYSEYSITHGGYTHYYVHWVNKDDVGRKNVKFTIANDYSPCISDTLARETASGTWANIDKFMEEGGDLKRSANVRYMWDKRDNTISRAYVDGAQGDYSTNFLYMLNVEDEDDKIKKSDGTALTDHKVTFKDNGNWMYEANVKAQPTAQIRLLSNWGTENTITQYFKGASDKTETLLGGSGTTWYDIRVIYDFKTNRLIAGLIPSGTIDEQMAIHADVMFIREHHGDIAQLTFVEKDDKMGAITDIQTAFGVLQFNKWTVNNKAKDTHAPLVGEDALSRFERDLFYISFPFKVAMEDVFGFGTYGQHWIIEEYDGATRASNGYWLESDPNWKFIFNRKNKYFEPGQGYIIALDLDEMGESSSVWSNTEQVELYFPSYGTMDNITSSTATYEIPAHLCTINRSGESNGRGGTLGPDYDRRVKDSHWNVLGVPTYVNPDAPNFANTAWTTTATETSIGPDFLYEWNKEDNSVTAVTASSYTYHAMHAYLVQYCGDVTWTSSVSVTPPASIAARRTSAGAPQNAEFKLELMQNEKKVDQTYVKLSDDEHVTTGFEFNYDLSKEFNKNKANIYTLIGTEQVAGNVLPLTDQTTIVPVGVKIAADGDYTFAIPDGTNGVGVTLIDNETGIRTSLSALDYTINLSAGTYDERFVLEISPVRPISTDLEAVTGDGLQVTGARKIMIDGILYIVKDGKMFDAQGRQVK